MFEESRGEVIGFDKAGVGESGREERRDGEKGWEVEPLVPGGEPGLLEMGESALVIVGELWAWIDPEPPGGVKSSSIPEACGC